MEELIIFISAPTSTLYISDTSLSALLYSSELYPTGCTKIKRHQLYQAVIREKKEIPILRKNSKNQINTLSYFISSLTFITFSQFSLRKRVMILAFRAATFLLFLIELEAMKRISLDYTDKVPASLDLEF